MMMRAYAGLVLQLNNTTAKLISTKTSHQAGGFIGGETSAEMPK